MSTAHGEAVLTPGVTGETRRTVARCELCGRRTYRLRRHERTLIFASAALCTLGAALGVFFGLFNETQAPQYVQLYPATTSVSTSLVGHPGSAATDMDTTSYWAVPGRGLGQSLKITFSSVENVAAVSFIPGDQATPGTIGLANQPKQVELEFSVGPPVFETVTSGPQFQALRFAARPTTFVKMVILSSFRGKGAAPRWSFCAVSEFEAYALS